MNGLPDLDDAVLVSKALHLAHSADQRLTTGQQDPACIRRDIGSDLDQVLCELQRRGLPQSDPLRWAREILRQLDGAAVAEAPASASAMTPTDILGLVRSRRSIRAWAVRPVDDEQVNQLLEAARWAPSSCNRQPVRMVVVRHPDCRDAVAGFNKPFLRQAPVLILVGIDRRLYRPVEVAGGVPYLDVGAAVQNMLLVAHAAGLGCLWANAAPEVWRFRPEVYHRVRDALRLPHWYWPASIVAVGWPKAPVRVPPRHELDRMVRRDAEGFPKGKDARPWPSAPWSLWIGARRMISALLHRR